MKQIEPSNLTRRCLSYSFIRLSIEGNAINLSEAQRKKFSRQLSLPAMDEEKQARLLDSCALLVHATDATRIVFQHLVEAGVGRIVVVSSSSEARCDFVSGESNVEFQQFTDLDHLEKLVAGSDVVLESLLNWQLKLGLSDICMRSTRPLIHSGVVGHRYQVYCMQPGKSACLRCVLPVVGIEDYPLEEVDAHPLLQVDAWAASIMSLEAMKLVADFGVVQSKTLWRFDALSGESEAVRDLLSRADCPDCGPNRSR